MSALPPKADISEGCLKCLLMTQSGHWSSYAIWHVGAENQDLSHPIRAPRGVQQIGAELHGEMGLNSRFLGECAKNDVTNVKSGKL